MTKGKFWLRLVPLDDNAGCIDIGPQTKSGYYPNDSRAYEAAREVLKEHKKVYIMKLDNFGECFHDVMSLYITYN